MASKVRVPYEWDIRLEARLKTGETKRYNGVGVGNDPGEAIEDLPDDADKALGRDTDPDDIVYMLLEAKRRG